MAKSSDYGGIFFNPSTGEHYSRIYDQPEISPDAIEAYRRFISQESDSEPVGELTYNDVSGENLIDVPYEEPRITERSVDLSGMIPEKRTAQEPKKNDAVRDFLKGTWEKASSPEMMAFGWLPMLGMAEVLASKGKSKGDAAMAMQKNVLSGIQQKKQDEIAAAEREQAARDSALKRQLTEAQIAEASKKAASAQSQQERTDRYNAAVAEAYSREDIDDAEKDRLAMGLYKAYFPAEYNKMAAQAALRPEWDEDEYRRRKQIDSEYKPKQEPPRDVNFSKEAALRREYAARSKDYIQVRDAYNRINASAKDPSAAGDLAMIFNYMKMLDPGSTVREGEFATAQNAGGIGDRIRAQYNQVISGQRLVQDQRSDFLNRSSVLYGAQLESQRQLAKGYEDIARDFGLNSSAITGGIIQPAFGDGHFGSRDEAEAAYERGEIKPGTRLYINGRFEGVAE